MGNDHIVYSGLLHSLAHRFKLAVYIDCVGLINVNTLYTLYFQMLRMAEDI